MYLNDPDKVIKKVLIAIIIASMVAGWCIIEGIIWLCRHINVNFI